MNLNDLKKLAGVTGEKQLDPGEVDYESVAKKRKKERDENIKPGDQEWFDLWFGKQSGQMNMPTGFRGRKR